VLLAANLPSKKVRAERACMGTVLYDVATIAVAAAALVSIVYVAASAVVVTAWRRRPSPRSQPVDVPVTILKPLCGLEPGLADNLRSFCREATPSVEILFGARSGDDPALAVADRVLDEFPLIDARIVVGGQHFGHNHKINTLANALPSARHEVLVVADSDTRLEAGSLARIVAPLRDATVGVVSCLFWGRPIGALWSRLGALAINEWFTPSVLVSRALGSSAYCSGGDFMK